MDVRIILAIIIVIIALIGGIIAFIKLPKGKKIEMVKEWLKWAVAEAEKELGSGTGQLKLAKVYNMAVKQFPWIASLISFDTFKIWIDEALVWLNLQLETNEFIKTYIGK